MDACRTHSPDTRSVLRVRLGKPPWRTATASATAVPLLSRSSAFSSSSSSSWRHRFFWWLFLFHLRLIEECATEVLASGSRRKPWCLFESPRELAPSFRCDARVFPPLRRHAEAQVQHRLVPTHGLCKELHGLLFDAVLQGLPDRDVCGLQLRCVAT